MLILPYYETASKVRDVLLLNGFVDKEITIEGDTKDNGINKYETGDSIVIADSLKAYSYSLYNTNTASNHIQELIRNWTNQVRKVLS